MNEQNISTAIKQWISDRFNLHIDKANESDVIQSIKKNSEFIGANLWTLIFAIFIASIGLNVNSTAVIIGAMLISPLMGPIMGIGLGVAIVDLKLVQKGARNLAIATIISIATSTFYFWLTPLHEAQSELLARTTPSIWDVFIAFVGGLAGIVAGTRKEKSNVIPGVAIATALMPPLCTAGFGIATGNIYYFLGAIYLYFINSVFICLSTVIIIRLLRFKRVHFEDKGYEKKVSRIIMVTVIITVIPSIFMAYRIVDKSIFETNANKFVREQFHFLNTQVVNKTFSYSSKKKEIDLLLIGRELSQASIDSIRLKLKAYNLDSTHLIIRQGLDAKQEIDFTQIKASILEDVFRQDSTRRISLLNKESLNNGYPDLRNELKVMYPTLLDYSVTNVVKHYVDSIRDDSITLVVMNFKKPIRKTAQKTVQEWLKARLKADSVELVLQ